MPASIDREPIERLIHVVRGERVMLDADLARIYDVSTKVLVQAVKRNLLRFPHDFMFHLTSEETDALRSQVVTSNVGRGGRRYAPYAFTEQGVAMLSSVLRSPRAIAANVAIMRAFVRFRQMLGERADFVRRLAELERKYDAQFKIVFDAIRGLMSAPEGKPRRIGFEPRIHREPAGRRRERGL